MATVKVAQLDKRDDSASKRSVVTDMVMDEVSKRTPKIVIPVEGDSAWKIVGSKDIMPLQGVNVKNGKHNREDGSQPDQQEIAVPFE